MSRQLLAMLIIAIIIVLCFIFFMPSVFSSLTCLSPEQVRAIENLTETKETGEGVTIEWQ